MRVYIVTLLLSVTCTKRRCCVAAEFDMYCMEEIGVNMFGSPDLSDRSFE